MSSIGVFLVSEGRCCCYGMSSIFCGFRSIWFWEKEWDDPETFRVMLSSFTTSFSLFLPSAKPTKTIRNWQNQSTACYLILCGVSVLIWKSHIKWHIDLNILSCTVNHIIKRIWKSPCTMGKAKNVDWMLDLSLSGTALKADINSVMEIKAWAQVHSQKSLPVSTVQSRLNLCHVQRKTHPETLLPSLGQSSFNWGKAKKSKCGILFGKHGCCVCKLKRRLTIQPVISTQNLCLHLWQYGGALVPIRHWQLAPLERHHRCWKVYTGFGYFRKTILNLHQIQQHGSVVKKSEVERPSPMKTFGAS